MTAFSLSKNNSKQLLELFEQLEAEGVVKRHPENSIYVPWRFDLYRFDGQKYYVKCYSGKKGYRLDTTIPGLSALVDRGTFKEIKLLLRSSSVTKKSAAVSDCRNPYGQLKRMPVKELDRVDNSAGVRVRKSNLSSEQAQVFQQITDWTSQSRQQVLKLGGYAGTGKTTLIALLATTFTKKKQVAFCSFTGKATNVLRQKLQRSGVNLQGVYCGTIHGLIYDPLVDEGTGQVLKWILRPELEQDLLVIDEASMLSDELWRDLLSYQIPILAVGDHGQLPPVTREHEKERQIYLMDKPDLILERIHRQAEANPILKLATHVRKGGDPLDFEVADNRVRVIRTSPEELPSLDFMSGRVDDPLDIVVLCFKNSTRVGLNYAIREQTGLGTAPLSPGETVICLRNTRFGKMSIFNGMRGQVREVRQVGEHHLDLVIDFTDDRLSLLGRLSRHQFGRSHTFDSLNRFADETGLNTSSWERVGLLFDYGYALTVHKAQGSQFSEVFIVVEDSYYLDRDPDFRKRWLYTAITRAVERITLITLCP